MHIGRLNTKFQAIAEKTATKSLRYFLAHPVGGLHTEHPHDIASVISEAALAANYTRLVIMTKLKNTRKYTTQCNSIT